MNDFTVSPSLRQGSKNGLKAAIVYASGFGDGGHKHSIKRGEAFREALKEIDFAVTDLSHSRAIIEVEGHDVREVLKKGCPYNFNILEKNNSINSTYNGIAFTVDMIDDNPDKIRLFALRSFGESLYHSITDSSLEFGYKAI